MRAFLSTVLLLVTPLAPAAGEPAVVTAAAETPPLYDDEAGGFANGDDPAIWVHPTLPGRSIVITTAKEGGLYAYALSGARLQHLPAQPPPGPDHEPGRLNNVDLVRGFRLSTGAKVDLAIASDRGRDQLRVYAIDPVAAAAGRPPLTDVTDPAVPFVFNATQEEVDEAQTAYGLAVSGTRVVVSRRHRTTIGLLQLAAAPGGKVTYRRVRTLDLPATFPLPDGTTWVPCGEPGELPQVEGMVVDRGTLYAAQEDVGIWRLRADLTSRPVLMDKVREYGRQDTYDPTPRVPAGPGPRLRRLPPVGRRRGPDDLRGRRRRLPAGLQPGRRHLRRLRPRRQPPHRPVPRRARGAGGRGGGQRWGDGHQRLAGARLSRGAAGRARRGRRAGRW